MVPLNSFLAAPIRADPSINPNLRHQIQCGPVEGIDPHYGYQESLTFLIECGIITETLHPHYQRKYNRPKHDNFSADGLLKPSLGNFHGS